MVSFSRLMDILSAEGCDVVEYQIIIWNRRQTKGNDNNGQ